jgi:nitrogen fixation NifU-like protein
MAYISEVTNRFEAAIKVKRIKSLDKRSRNVGTGLVGAPACGDVMRVSVEVDENNVIINSDFKIFGCGAAVASASLAADLIKNITVHEALKVTNDQISLKLKLPPVKRHCSLLAEQAIRAAILDYQNKQKNDQVA